jgi:hypothetical protein
MKLVLSPGNRIRTLLVGSLAAILLISAVSGRAGSVVEARGQAWVERASQVVPLRPGTPLEEGDKLNTGPGAEVLLRFQDDARMLVRGDSRLELRELLRKDELRKQIINIVKGALRYVSSVATPRQQVNFTSAQATIGIRGTDIEIALEEAVAAYPAATYLKVNRGVGVLTGLDGAEVELTEGQVALALEAELFRAGVRSIRRPSAMRLQTAPAHLFQPGTMDSLMR